MMVLPEADQGGLQLQVNKQSRGEISMQQQLEREVQGLNQREAEYFRLAGEADRVVIVTGCDDSRQGIPEGIQEINWGGENQRVLFHFIPVIGGGVARAVLPGTVSRFVEQGVSGEKIGVLVTQHGNSAEVNAAVGDKVGEKVTCGLRGVLQKIEAGESVHVHKPLLEHAGTINKSSSIVENGEYAYQQTVDLLSESGVEVWGGYFDHEGSDQDGKSVTVVLGTDQPFSFSIPDQLAWHEGYQNPEALVVSFGPRAASLPDGVILSETVGNGANNDFNSAGVDEASFLNAMREQWYALSHVGGHGEDKNFADTQVMVILCDGDEQVCQAQAFMKSDEFTTAFAAHVRRLPKGIHLANLTTGKVESLTV